MSEKTDLTDDSKRSEKRESIYQVSANRGRSRHKVRYVEASAPEEGACKLCVGVMASDSAKPESAENTNGNDINNDNSNDHNDKKDDECSD